MRIVSLLIAMTVIFSNLGFSDTRTLQRKLDRLSAQANGRLGVCISPLSSSSSSSPICIRGDEWFPLQSVMKLVVSVVVYDKVDRGELALTDKIVIRPSDISPGPQEFADFIIQRQSYQATIQELIWRAVAESDSTSIDVLIARIGGLVEVQKFLQRMGFEGISIDRTERDLQSDSVGLVWRQEYSTLSRFENKIIELSPEVRNRAWISHLLDPRDKATPLSMANFLRMLADEKLLSQSSTKNLIDIMLQTTTGKDRLSAGLLPGWTLSHKTGTGRTWQGKTETINDVGLLISPQGEHIAIAVFLAEAGMPSYEQGAVIAQVARLVCEQFGTNQMDSKGPYDPRDTRDL